MTTHGSAVPCGVLAESWLDARIGLRCSAMAGACLAGVLVAGCSSTNAPPGTLDSGTDSSVGVDSGSAADAATTDAGPGATDSGGASSRIVAACLPSDAGATTIMTFGNQSYALDPRARPDEAVFTGINTLDDPYLQTMRLHNGGTAPITVTSIGVAAQSSLFSADYRQHSLPAAFKVAVALPLPATIAANGDLDVKVQFLSTKTAPPPRLDNVGGDAVAALLVAQTSTDCVQAGLYGVALWNDDQGISEAGVPDPNYARYEPTFGQIVATLGYRINIGANLKTYLNVNQVDPANVLAPPPFGDSPSDEVLVRDFVKADASQPVTLLAVARFAPKLDYPFGFFPTGSVDPSTSQPAALSALAIPDAGGLPPGLRIVSTMTSENDTDSYTSDHSEMLFPPIGTNPSGAFDPGAAPFGIWSFSAQRSDGTVAFDGGVTPNQANGDYDYTFDELNVIAGPDGGPKAPVHRSRVYPLRDRAGKAVQNAYLIGWEEAANGDYQDFIFTLGNVKPAAVAGDGGPAPSDAGGADAEAGADAGAGADADAGFDADAGPEGDAGAVDADSAGD